MEDLFKNNRRVFTGEVGRHLRTYQEGKEVVPGIHRGRHPRPFLGAQFPHRRVGREQGLCPGRRPPMCRSCSRRNPGWHAFYDQDPVMAEATPPQGL